MAIRSMGPPRLKSCPFHKNSGIILAEGHATIAQLVEQTFRKRQVKGPIPFGGSKESPLHSKIEYKGDSTIEQHCKAIWSGWLILKQIPKTSKFYTKLTGQSVNTLDLYLHLYHKVLIWIHPINTNLGIGISDGS
jgi:hypothetical protein